ncbi:MAG: Ig-like domain-containing protein [Flavobacterium sp.]|nr:Ig-like domain-containing protein [Flavobacterium sp.]
MIKSKYFFFLVLIALALTGCAKRGNITGGTLDTIPPRIKMSTPANFSTGFKDDKIRIVFDEYIKLKNINKQLIVSPPMTRPLEITPQTASRYIDIKIKDTLQPNTTYSINFGQSIEDNNEGNPYPQFKYVFSTGSYIDSLTLRGRVKDAYLKQPDSYISIMLYEANENFTDSTIYKTSPRYITNTLDSATTFQFDNLKEGKYMLIALKDENSNNRFDPRTDKIGFHREFIQIPNDTLYELELFKEDAPFRILKPSQTSGGRAVVGYEGNPKDLKLSLRNGNSELPIKISKMANRDSLVVWHKPVAADSLQLVATNADYTRSFYFRTKESKTDTLTFSGKSGNLHLREDFSITSTVPMTEIDKSKMQLINKDSVAVPFDAKYDSLDLRLRFVFEKEPLEKYRVRILPGAITDFFGRTNDSLSYNFATRNSTEYGNLRLTLENVRQFPVIVELTNDKGDVKAEAYSDAATVIDFNALEPALYTLRIIYDENRNKVWDTGSFLERRQTEQVIYFPTPIDVRANWDVDQTFSLK